MEKVGRNDKCPCGSGKKYKNCHQQIEDTKVGRKKSLVIGGVIALFIIFAALGFYLNSQPQGNDAPAAAGEAPAGKVWSEEHGHWHNAE